MKHKTDFSDLEDDHFTANKLMSQKKKTDESKYIQQKNTTGLSKKLRQKSKNRYKHIIYSGELIKQ